MNCMTGIQDTLARNGEAECISDVMANLEEKKMNINLERGQSLLKKT